MCSGCLRVSAFAPSGLSQEEERLRTEEFKNFVVGKTSWDEVRAKFGVPSYSSKDDKVCVYRWEKEYNELLLITPPLWVGRIIKYNVLLMQFDDSGVLRRYEHRQLKDPREDMLGPMEIRDWAHQGAH